MLKSKFQSGNFHVYIYDSLDDGALNQWIEFNPTHLSHAYLQFIDNSKPKDLQFLYVAIESKSNSGQQTCAIIYFQVLKFSNKNFNFKNLFFVNNIFGFLLRLFPFKVLVGGNLFAVNFPPIEYHKNSIQIKDILKIISEIEEQSKPDIFFLKDLDAAFSFDTLEVFGWKKYSTDLTMEMKIDPSWNSINDYTALLKKKYRKRAEKIIKSGKSMIRKELTKDDLLKYKKEMNELFNQVAEKQTIRMGIIGENYFYNYSFSFPHKFSIVGYFLESRLIGFASYIKHDSTLELHYIGIDYKFNNERMIYFNILMDGVERAIQIRANQLELGRTAREAKANLGAHPVYFNDFIKIRSWLFSLLFNRLSTYFQTQIGEKWVSRDPFVKK